METLNRAVFLWLNAPLHPDPLVLVLAKILADYAIVVVPSILLIGWLRNAMPARKTFLVATAAGLLGLLLNQLIGMAWPHPRPFMIGLGQTLITHVADASFPSDHLTLLWAVGFSLLVIPASRAAGIGLTLLGLPMAWARIYLGVHFPLDMVGSAGVAGFSSWLAIRLRPWYLESASMVATAIHLRVFGYWIRTGRIRK